ncbi:MAG: T9SS type A sorting domain-containing protein, partial [Paludibacter sp.]|nr:T9SS type A sorting domain-containing protein [Paludibacter sp.]
AKRNDNSSLQLAGSDVLTPGLAYEICNQTHRKYSFAGTLNTADFSKTLQYTPTAYYKGQNLLSNPYTGSMDIRNMQFGANTQAAVYLYNSGTYNNWLTSNGETTPGEGPGTYKVLTPGTAGSGGVDAEIAGMQGFIVKATANPGSVSYAKSALVSNSQKQRAKAVDTKMSTMIDLKGDKFSDRMWLFEMDNCTSGFDNGFDGPKMLANADVAQLYGIGTDDNYQINVLNDINNAYIGIQKGTESNFKLIFKHTNFDQKYQSLYLFDMVDNKTVDITASGSEYSFTSNVSDPAKRFKIIGEGLINAIDKVQDSDLKLLVNENRIIVSSKLAEIGMLKVFDCTGKLIATKPFASNSITTLQPKLNQGIYIVKLTVGNQEQTQRIIIK